VFVGITAIASDAESKAAAKEYFERKKKILFPAPNVFQIIEPNKKKFHK